MDRRGFAFGIVIFLAGLAAVAYLWPYVPKPTAASRPVPATADAPHASWVGTLPAGFSVSGSLKGTEPEPGFGLPAGTRIRVSVPIHN